MSNRRIEIFIRYTRSDGFVEIEACGLYRMKIGACEIFSTETLPLTIPICLPDQLALNFQCVVVTEDHIYTDPFGSIPLYYINDSDCLKISSSPERLIKYSDHPFDPVGVWECFLYGASLWTRTPFMHLHQIPAAAQLAFANPENIGRYTIPALRARSSENDTDSSIDAFDAGISSAFEVARGKKVYMGLSGGIDCRLALLYLLDVVDSPSSISTFTFASDSNSHEIRFARETCKILGLSPPDIFLLDYKHYKAASEYLPLWTAGQISSVHGHISEYLRSQELDSDSIHLSTYYSDAIFGWACEVNQTPLSLGMDKCLSKLRATTSLPRNILDSIELDLYSSLSTANQDSNLSCLGEYQYIIERHPKFHMQLAYCQAQFHPMLLPFARGSLLELSQQLPLQVRGGKNIIDSLIRRKKPDLFRVRNSSSREYFYGTNSILLNSGLAGKIRFMRFRGLNLISNLLAWLPLDVFRYSSPFQTENLYRLYVNHFHDELLKVLDDGKLTSALALDSDYQQKLRKIAVRDTHLAERFELIDIAGLNKL